MSSVARVFSDSARSVREERFLSLVEMTRDVIDEAGERRVPTPFLIGEDQDGLLGRNADHAVRNSCNCEQRKSLPKCLMQIRRMLLKRIQPEVKPKIFASERPAE